MWVPILHTPPDLGSLAATVEERYTREFGRDAWGDHVRRIAGLWETVRAGVDALGLDYRRVRLYQDGLPVCGREADIVRDLARAGSLNHQLLLGLVGRGARLTGTEDPGLLLREYERARLGETAGGGHAPAALLEQRDRFIAGRIAATLAPGEVGLAFLGMLHSLAGKLAGDIGLETLPVGNPKDGGNQPHRLGQGG